jgi:hypothetical protein
MLLAALPLLTFLTNSGGPATGDIHDVPIVPAAAVVHIVNGVPVVGLRSFAGVPFVLVV